MKREISSWQREIQDTESFACADCVALCRIISYGSADSLFTVALAEVNLVRPVSVSANARGRTRSSASLPTVSPCVG